MHNEIEAHDPLTAEVIGAAIEVHRKLGPGLMESACKSCLAQELIHRNMAIQVEAPLPLTYRGVRLEVAYRVDMIVENELFLELKVVNKLEPVHKAQLLTYLRLSGKQRGLMINFHVPFLREGIQRLVNNYKPVS
ncbi:MAG: GxxExxY protein [Planctomycetales bacterium]|nr:GxxExxY protein [bacterium]UNM06867.1 MAG: GxxExxY protein [Planctomycetales bacterium]